MTTKMWTSLIFEPFKNEYFDYIVDNSTCEDVRNATRVFPSECIMPEVFMEYGMKIKNLKVYPDDIWIVSFPECGAERVQEMVWLIKKNLDYGTAMKVDLKDRFLYLEFNNTFRNKHEISEMVLKCETMQRPRLIKSQLPIDLLPDELLRVKPKVFYVTRNPKDVAISLYYVYKKELLYEGSLEGFVNAFLGDVVFYAPYWKHVLRFWDLRKEPYVSFINFEETEKDLPAVIRRTAKFLGKHVSDADVSRLAFHVRSRRPKKRRTVSFQGFNNDTEQTSSKTGDNSPTELTPELVKRFDDWIREQTDGTDYDASI